MATKTDITLLQYTLAMQVQRVHPINSADNPAFTFTPYLRQLTTQQLFALLAC